MILLDINGAQTKKGVLFSPKFTYLEISGLGNDINLVLSLYFWSVCGVALGLNQDDLS